MTIDSFGEKLHKLRVKKGLTQKEIAKLLGITSRTYYSYEVQNTIPRNSTILEKIADILDTRVDYLLATNLNVSEFDTGFFQNNADTNVKKGQLKQIASKSLMELETICNDPDIDMQTIDEISIIFAQIYCNAKKRYYQNLDQKVTLHSAKD